MGKVPNVKISSQNTQWSGSNVWVEPQTGGLQDGWGCKIAYYTVSRHGNGQIERFNQRLLQMLGTLKEYQKIDWKALMPTLVHACNSDTDI